MDGSDSQQGSGTASCWRSERELALAAVRKDWLSLESVPEIFKADHEVVLTAVKSNGEALMCASENCQADREIVLAAVKTWGQALQCASEGCKCDREIVEMAVEQDMLALGSAGDSLLDDSSFAVEARRHFWILRVFLLSGRHTYFLWQQVLSSEFIDTAVVITSCCKRLGLHRQGTERLLHDGELVLVG
mmetsp:Transcript_49094/g.90564  ORF Transcript_49094/g.90564 Transcript_49094/m.90564 type:complete len:190 (-) Transcript_49094:8-577(-)